MAMRHVTATVTLTYHYTFTDDGDLALEERYWAENLDELLALGSDVQVSVVCRANDSGD